MKHTPGLKPGTNIETSARTRDCLLANETNDASDSLRGKRPREREKGKTSARGAGGSDAGGSRLFSLPRSFDFPTPLILRLAMQATLMINVVIKKFHK